MEQLNLFDFPKYKIKNKIRLIELFAGIGSQAMALRNIGANFESWRVCEFDKYAIASYNAIFGTNYAPSDIQKLHAEDLGIIDRDNYTYLMTYSFPCTDLSVAGKMQGMSKADWQNGNSTRSGLLWEVERILKECDELPQVLLMENVPQVHAEQNRADFESWLAFLRGKGYHNFYKDLNAKDYGIPQNRDRCFCVSILSPDFIEYDFPETVKLESVMKDYLEENVDEKYYINSEKADKLIAEHIEGGELPRPPYAQDCQVVVLGQMDNTLDHTFESANRVYDKNQLCPTISTCGGGGTQPKVIIEKEQLCAAMRGRGMDNKQTLEPNATGCTNALTTVQKDNLVIEQTKCIGGLNDGKWGGQFHQQDRVYKGDIALALPANIPNGLYNYVVEAKVEVKQATKDGAIKCKVCGCYDASYPNSTTPRGRVQNGGDVTPTITAQGGENINYVETLYRIRKLTPRECWRLMGFSDTDYKKAEKVCSNTQLYKQAGNSIVVDVLEAIFKNLIE